MKKHSMPEMKEGGVNVTPLIDIVMCLIIFFMLVAKIGVTKGDDDVPLPSTILGTKIEDLSQTLTLNIHPSPLADPQVTALVNSKVQEIKLEENFGSTHDRPLLRVLKEFKRTHAADPKIILRADKDLAYGQLEKVLLTVAEAEIGNVAYETKEMAETQAPAAAE